MLQLLVIGLHNECDHEANRAEQKTERKPAAPASPLVAEDYAAGDAAQQPEYQQHFHYRPLSPSGTKLQRKEDVASPSCLRVKPVTPAPKNYRARSQNHRHRPLGST